MNYASFHNGARVIYKLTSSSIPVPFHGLFESTAENAYVDLLVRDSHGPSLPEAALGLMLDARALWFFNDTPGILTVSFPSPVFFEAIHFIGHPTKRPCQPRAINAWGLVVPPDARRVRYGMFVWPDFPVSLQVTPTLPITRSAKGLFVRESYPRWIPLGQFENLPRGEGSFKFSLSSEVLHERFPVHMVALEFLHNWGAPYTCFAGLEIYPATILP
ncbi:hypothetical protein AURDEDRAFT_172133 [Auricularia subglabra TFB-10046 SS5]|nr:hypothetical protein AURDEDRAFT_172133 [Auricularia subglabra TFB-10046 SS5]